MIKVAAAYLSFKRRSSVEVHDGENDQAFAAETITASDDRKLRKTAFLIVENLKDSKSGTLDAYHRWIADSSSEQKIENWFQEN